EYGGHEQPAVLGPKPYPPNSARLRAVGPARGSPERREEEAEGRGDRIGGAAGRSSIGRWPLHRMQLYS
uniref:Uncharacterized protein n=1 Tax=Aegilops tauschii subsp. strangulata TaxID=200361 RepID=A0A453PCM2_AEGTS